VRSTSNRPTIKAAAAALTCALFATGISWLGHSFAAPSKPSESQTQSASPNPRFAQPQVSPTPCSSCAEPGLQTIYAPLVAFSESSATEINLNCRSSHTIDVTPTFFTQKGETFVGNVFQMLPTEVKTVDLSTLMPRAIRHRRDLGGMTLSYDGGILEMWAQLRLMNVADGGSIDVVFSILQDRRSDVRNAVWWMPNNAEVIIAIGNFGKSTMRATARFADGDSETLEVPGFGTHLLRVKSRKRHSNSSGNGEGITIEAPDSHGSLVTTGLVYTKDGSLATSIRFYDTQNVAQANLYATNFRLAGVQPRLLLRNIGSQTISAIPRFIPAPGDPNHFIELPSVTLDPNGIAEVDIQPLKGAIYGISEFDHVSIQVLNNGAAGSLIGALTGKDDATGMTYDVPLRDIGAVRNSTGAYPWRLDQDLSTVVSITNVATAPSGVVVQINYAGGHYLLDPRRVAAGETVIYDLRKIRDEQIPDRNGHTIPRSVKSGQFKWYIYGPGSGRLIGRAEMLSSSEGISSSYSCPGGNCPPTFSYAFLDQDDIELTPFEGTTVTAYEIDCDYYGCYGPIQPWVTGWDNSNPFSVGLSDQGTQAILVGISGGSSEIHADISYERWGWDGLNCYSLGIYVDAAYAQVRVLGLKIKSPNATGNIHDTTQKAMLGATVPLTTEIPSGTEGGSYEWKIDGQVVGGNSSTHNAVINTLGEHSISVKYQRGNRSVTKSLTLNVFVPEIDVTQSGASYSGQFHQIRVRTGSNCIESLFNPNFYITTGCPFEGFPGMDMEAFVNDHPGTYISNPGESHLKLVQIVNVVFKKTDTSTGVCKQLTTTGWMLDGVDPAATGPVHSTSSGPNVALPDTPHVLLVNGFNYTDNSSFETYLVYYTGSDTQPQNQKAIAVLVWSIGASSTYDASNESHSAVAGSLSPEDGYLFLATKLVPTNSGTGIRAYNTTPFQSINVNDPANYQACP
jgi:hypothetical protein